MSEITVQVVYAFEDPEVRPEVWSRLLREGDTDVGALTWQAQKLWWQFHERPGALRLLVAKRDGQPVAIAPLFVEAGMAMNLCPATTLDLLGDTGDPAILDAMLYTIRGQIADFVGLRLHFVPHTSRTGPRLRSAADRQGLDCFLEDEQPSPIIDLRRKPDAALSCTRKKTTLRRENELRREGTLDVHHFREVRDVMPQLDAFFEQHIARWAETPTPSRFRDPTERESFRVRTKHLADTGWLRFSRMDWCGRPIAFHRGTCYRGRYKYGRSAYDPDLSGFSPGAVLLRHLLLAAIEEEAHTFDFGLGDEAYKFRYATDVIQLQTWGVYSSSSSAS